MRNKLRGTSQKPRLSVHKSVANIYAQVIDDDKGITIAASSTLEAKDTRGKLNLKTAEKVGLEVAKKAIKSGVKEVVFDRGNKQYHGKIKAVAEAARKEGLKF